MAKSPISDTIKCARNKPSTAYHSVGRTNRHARHSDGYVEHLLLVEERQHRNSRGTTLARHRSGDLDSRENDPYEDLPG